MLNKRDEMRERLLDVAKAVTQAQRDGVGSTGMCADIVTTVRALSTVIGQAYDRQGAVADETLVRFMGDFCAFVMQDFPFILTQGFEGLSLSSIYEVGSQVHDLEYLYQNAWAAEHVLAIRPRFFLDVGSQTSFVTLVSRSVPCIAVDARPTPVDLPNLTYRQGEAQALPFDDATAPMVTSLHAPEHFGLGRYGDSLDIAGVERAVAEYLRVLEPGGHLAISMPLGPVSRIEFNELRIYTRDMMRSLFEGCGVVEEVPLGPTPLEHEEVIRRVEAGNIRSGVHCMLLRKRV